MFKPRLSPAIASALLCMAGLAAWGLHFGVQASSPATSPRPALTVAVGQPERQSWPQLLTANGSVAAWQEAIVGVQVQGLRLTELRAGVGDTVRAGQVLAVFDDESVRTEIAQARAALAEAQAVAAEAQANAERARSLQGSGALSAQQIQQYQTAAQTAQARLALAQAQLEAQQLRGRQSQVLAPVAGVVVARSATVGSVPGPGTELFRLVRDGRLEWRAEVTADELARLRPGLPVTVHTAGGASLSGKVRLLAPTVDPQTRTALVYVDLPAMAQAPGARPGLFARGEFRLGQSPALTVPQQALVVRDGFEFVFQMQPGDRVAEVRVRTGRRLGDRVELLSGLAPEARVVIQGAGFLNDGDLVQVAPAPAAPPRPSSARPAPAAR